MTKAESSMYSRQHTATKRRRMDPCCLTLTHTHTHSAVSLAHSAIPKGDYYLYLCALSLSINYSLADVASSGNFHLYWCTSQRYPPHPPPHPRLPHLHLPPTFHVMSCDFSVAPLSTLISSFRCSCVPYCLFAVALLLSLQKAANAHCRGGSPACQRRQSRMTAMLSCVSGGVGGVGEIFTESVWMGENAAGGGEAAGVVTVPNTD